jgi:hypothetical protein
MHQERIASAFTKCPQLLYTVRYPARLHFSTPTRRKFRKFGIMHAHLPVENDSNLGLHTTPPKLRLPVQPFDNFVRYISNRNRFHAQTIK